MNHDLEKDLLQLFADGEGGEAPAPEAPAEAAPQEAAGVPQPEQFAFHQVSQWQAQAERAREVYPGLDLAAEARNPQFARLLRSGVDVETAYTVVHREQILTAAMHHAARVARQQLSSAIRSGAVRPSENGLGAGSPGAVQSVAHLTRQQRDNIRRRAAQGEKIHF